jgi:hypothetical protein
VLLVRERPHPPRSNLRLWGGVKRLPREFKQYLLGIGIGGVGDFANTLLILWATQAWTPTYGAERATQMAILFYTGYNVVYTVTCYTSGVLADRLPKHRVLAVGYSFAVIPAVALLVPGDSLTKFAIVFGFSGLYTGVWETLENATAASVLPAGSRGIGFGALATINGFGDFISSFFVGLFWEISPALSMGLVIVTSIAGAAIIAWTGERAKR